MKQKQTSAILNKNGGLHSKRALKKVQELLNTHGLKRAILVHMVLTGSQSVQVYRDTYNDIADHIRDNGSRCEYFGCLEMDEDKGLHAHVYFVIETSKQFPHATLNVKDGEWLHRLADRRSLNRIHIAKPQNKIHHANGKAQFFARLEEKDGRFADCLERIEYLYKNRSKEKVPSREIYFNSNHKANTAKRVAKKATYSPIAALSAAKEENIPLEGGKVISAKAVKNSAVPAAFNPIQDKTPFPLVGSRLEGQTTLTEKETKHESSIRTGDGPASPGNTGTSSESGTSDPYSSSSGIYGQPRMGQARQGPRVPAPSPGPGPKAEAIRPERTHGGATGPAGEADLPITHSPGDSMTPAARYIASKYEKAVDLGLDLEAMRRYLLDRGIKRTPAAVVFDLDERYGFHGYAASHPAPPVMTLAAIDKSISRQYALSRLAPGAA